MKEFILQWKQFGFQIAFNNCLLGFTKKFIGAKKITITYLKEKENENRKRR